MGRLANVSICVIWIILLSLAAGQSLSAERQPVTFINSTPGSIIGLVLFETNESGNPIGYVTLNLDWTEKKKTIMLEPDLYGATKFDPISNMIIDYRQFWVRDKPITINM